MDNLRTLLITCCASGLLQWSLFLQNVKVLFTQIQRAHNLSVYSLSSLRSLALGPWWPAGLLSPQWLPGSLRRRCEQSQHSKVCCTLAALQAPWRCGPGTFESHWAVCFVFLLLPQPMLGVKVWESSAHPIVSAPGFPPVQLNFDISVWLVQDELLGPPFDDLGFHQGSEGCHGAK